MSLCDGLSQALNDKHKQDAILQNSNIKLKKMLSNGIGIGTWSQTDMPFNKFVQHKHNPIL
jgi:hypothetical protein